MRIKELNPPAVMTPLGGYSQGIVAGDTVYVAGQTGVDAQMKLPGDGGMAAQTRQAITNVAAVLTAAGAKLADVVSTTVYIKSIDDYSDFDGVYRECFGSHKPARATVRADLVSDALLIEIQAIAVKAQSS